MIQKKKWSVFISALFFMLIFSGCGKIEAPIAENTLDETLLEDKYFYQLLTEEEEKLVYKEIYQGLIEHTEAIYVENIDIDRAENILFEVYYDSPEIFWIYPNVETGGREEGLLTEGYNIVYPQYECTLEERTSKQAAIDAVMVEIDKMLPKDADEYDKIKFVYEYLVDTVTYVDDAPDNQNIYSALVNKETVCAGYARAYQYILNHWDVQCTYVSGMAGDVLKEGEKRDPEEDSHAWNLVKCDDEYYYVDVTWGDMDIDEKDKDGLEYPMCYEYLCCDDSLLKTHTLDEEIVMPECTSDDLNYYKLNKMYYDSVDSEKLLKAMRKSIKKKEKYTIFKFKNNKIYKKGTKKILEELIDPASETFFEIYNHLETMHYSYQKDDEFNKLILYWKYE